ncbi:C40 family peptidase [Latilactobacillus graminis]|uniref:NlpC P60 family protein n=2 Tax=Latilactobacillus graminis TaxID=60519 RepID=A0AA89I1H0_9LACO|nr:C40 family peptidase [Latilactobacillus graminis]KRM23610.1 nlpC P60 family protein [Latilactobacillus graminis DSM 20719]QFP80197.1 peptidoglycan endopeptidase [Latilactobacillus graminis]
MKKQKMTYLSSGIVGLAGLVLMGLQTNDAQAATSGTVNYTDGATTVWTSPEVGQKPTHYLATNQHVTIQATKQVYGQTWYKLGNDEWVSSQFITAGDTTAQPATTTPAVKNTVTANFQSGATTVWSDTTATQPTGEYLTYGTTKNVINQKDLNGTTWYQLESKGWVPASYVVLNNPNLTGVTPITNAPAVTPVAATTTTTEVQAPAAPQATTPAPATKTPAPATTTESTTPAAATSTPAATTHPAQTQTTTQSNQATAPVQQAPQANTNTPARGNAQTVINAALSQIGTPYVWGGTTPGQGLDCSGLVQYAYAQAGISLGRVTTAQEGAGQRVSLNNLQPGDILFWGGAGASYHDAIYIGGGQYVHAPQPGESVKTASISSYFMPSFAVRVL